MVTSKCVGVWRKFIRLTVPQIVLKRRFTIPEIRSTVALDGELPTLSVRTYYDVNLARAS